MSTKTATDAIDKTERSAPLVAGRACGYCTVCCYATLIDTPELQKGAGVTCTHCTGRGCGIYEARPPVCRAFFCGWWVWPELDDDWRPDRSGVLILPKTDNIPPSHQGREGCQLLVLGGEPSILRPGFAEKFLRLIQGGVPAFLAVPGPPGYAGAAQFMNEMLADAARRNARDAVLPLLLSTYRELLKRDFVPQKFKSALRGQ